MNKAIDKVSQGLWIELMKEAADSVNIPSDVEELAETSAEILKTAGLLDWAENNKHQVKIVLDLIFLIFSRSKTDIIKLQELLDNAVELMNT